MAYMIELLNSANIVITVSDNLSLTEEFRKDWRRRIDHLATRDTTEYLGLLLEADPDTLTIDDGDGFVVTQSGATVGEWPSEAALAADVAAFITLQEWLPGWEDLTGQTRDELIGRLRIFLEQCPACEGTLETEPRKADPEIPHVVCADCGSAMV